MRTCRTSVCLVFFALPCGVEAQTLPVIVSPNCGTTSTHFIVTGGGLPGTPYTCPDTCHIPAQVFLDGQTIYSLDCMTGFTIDLQNVPGHGCVACGLTTGPHVVKF